MSKASKGLEAKLKPQNGSVFSTKTELLKLQLKKELKKLNPKLTRQELDKKSNSFLFQILNSKQEQPKKEMTVKDYYNKHLRHGRS